MSTSTANRLPDIVWPTPRINNTRGALDAAGCMIERLSALLTSNSADMQEAFIENPRGLSEHQISRAYSIWMIYTLAGEKLTELENLIIAITAVSYAEPVTSIGKHVDLRRRALFTERLQAFRAADAVPIPPDADDDTFNSIADPTVEALMAFVNTRSPDLRAMHEKLTVIREQDILSNEGILDAIFEDVEHLARRYEINGDSADQAEG